LQAGEGLALQAGGVAPAAANVSLDTSSVDAAANELLDVSPVDTLDVMSIHPPTGHSNSNPIAEPTTSDHTNMAPEPAPTNSMLEEEVPTSSASWSGTLTSLLNTPLRSHLRLP
jgi:hypothetical protein